MRPTVRPGLQILRRDLHTVQLGMDWPGVAALRDTPAIAAVLSAIDGFRDARGVVLAASTHGPDRRACEIALGQLVECGAVVDGLAPRTDGVDESTWSAWWLLAGPGRDAAEVALLRRACRVYVDGKGAVADELRRLLVSTHVTLTEHVDGCALAVLVDDREPDRERSDDMMHTGLPHLWVYVRDLVAVVGPFVIPGETACLRCVDRARGELDRAWPTLLASSSVRPLRVPACDRVQASLAAAWAAQEVALWATDIPPQTKNRVVELPHGGGGVHSDAFDLHPLCGCGWPVWQDTMDI